MAVCTDDNGASSGSNIIRGSYPWATINSDNVIDTEGDIFAASSPIGRYSAQLS
jgi:hypothetical protein